MNQDPNSIRQQAADWLVHFESRPDSEQRDEVFEEWLAQDQQHRRIYDQMRGLWSAARPPNRNRLKKSVGTVILSFAAALCFFVLPWDVWQADYRSAKGEILSVTLPDGSKATLNTDSAINIDFDPDRRQVHVVQGEALFSVSHAHNRPFIVSTSRVTAEALGTRYSVATTEALNVVTVYESRVRVRARNNANQINLTAGTRAEISQYGIHTGTTALRDRPDWADQRLVFDRTPLASVVERLAEYHPGVLTLRPLPEINRQFTGVLPANDHRAAVALLCEAMGLKVRHFTPWIALLSEQDIADANRE